MLNYIHRNIEINIQNTLARGKSILLLGPRQTGKTTLIEKTIQPDISYTFARLQTRLRYEKNPSLLELELEEQLKTYARPPIIYIDEVQKIPLVMDIAQNLIDKKLAQFILTGSSARKLKRGTDINWLPGRVVVLYMTPLLFDELPESFQKIEEILLYGTLPNIVTQTTNIDRERDIYSYVQMYLEEEIRAEALVRNIGNFARFLEIAAGESGKQINFNKLSQDIGIADTTIANYYQILEDCLIISRIDPIIQSQTKRRLVKSPKYLFFDLGVRRACANEGTRLPQATMGILFEQYIGCELMHQSQFIFPHIKVRYWRDLAGPEVDYVLDTGQDYIPIEVKWTDKPNLADAKHLRKFMDEYPNVKIGYVICRTPHTYRLTEFILALPWQKLKEVFT